MFTATSWSQLRGITGTDSFLVSAESPALCPARAELQTPPLAVTGLSCCACPISVHDLRQQMTALQSQLQQVQLERATLTSKLKASQAEISSLQSVRQWYQQQLALAQEARVRLQGEMAHIQVRPPSTFQGRSRFLSSRRTVLFPKIFLFLEFTDMFLFLTCCLAHPVSHVGCVPWAPPQPSDMGDPQQPLPAFSIPKPVLLGMVVHACKFSSAWVSGPSHPGLPTLLRCLTGVWCQWSSLPGWSFSCLCCVSPQ